jgi:hypothetical protein
MWGSLEMFESPMMRKVLRGWIIHLLLSPLDGFLLWRLLFILSGGISSGGVPRGSEGGVDVSVAAGRWVL